ncbi:unnamed protein product [Penicillium glandicola]
MLVSNTGDAAFEFEEEAAPLNPTSVTQAPAPAQVNFEYPGPLSVGAGPVSCGPYGPPPIYPVSLNPAIPGPPSYGPPMMGTSLPHSQFLVLPPLSTVCINPSPFMAPSFLRELVENPENKSREGLVAYRKFMNWVHAVYHSSKSPEAFVQAWQQALREMEQAFGPPYLPPIYILAQFLAAVSVNPNAIPWVESLQFEKGFLPASIVDEAFVDFLEFEACRLGNQLSNLGNLDTAVTDMVQIESFPKQYCPYHQRFTRHPVEECFRNPQNTKRKRKWRRKQARMAAAMEAEKDSGVLGQIDCYRGTWVNWQSKTTTAHLFNSVVVQPERPASSVISKLSGSDTSRSPQTSTTATTNAKKLFTSTTSGKPNDIFKTTMNPCHIFHKKITHKKYRWIQVAYNTADLPQEFVRKGRPQS